MSQHPTTPPYGIQAYHCPGNRTSARLADAVLYALALAILAAALAAPQLSAWLG